MRAKSQRGRTMITAEQALNQIQPDLLNLLRIKEQKLGSRMAAYDRLSARLGRSPSWIRKVVGRAPDVVVGLHDYLNIQRLCERLEAAAARNEAEAAQIQGDLDARKVRESIAALAALSRAAGLDEDPPLVGAPSQRLSALLPREP